MLKMVIVGGTMFGAGAFVGYFFSRKALEEQYQCDVKEIRDLYNEKLAELEGMIEAVDPSKKKKKVVDEEETDEERDIRETLASYRGQRRPGMIEYNKPSLESFKNARNSGVSVVVPPNGDENLGNIDDDEDERDEHTSDDPEYEADLERDAEEYARRQTENMRNGEPYLIDPDEYREGPEDYDHQVLYYYAGDRTLCEDDDSEVEEEEACVGLDYEDKLDMQTTCWIRNDTLRVLYEIHRIDESYAKVVKGVSETPREREFRLQGRRKQALDNQSITREP